MRRPKRRRRSAIAKIGVIAEDKSDVEVVRRLLNTLMNKPFNLQSFCGNGCGRIKSKCRGWSRDLSMRGCSALILIQDADMNDARRLTAELEAALRPPHIERYVIVVPVREVEAWLLADQDAIRAGMRIKDRIRAIANPEAIARPKEYLRDLIARSSRNTKRYINTIHNPAIAEYCRIGNLRRCISFLPLEQFVRAGF